MQIKIKMTEIATGIGGFVFEKITDAENAQRIVAHMNKLNSEAARLSGKAIRFVFSIVVKY